jgi:molybdopterin biosynthesis enzyme
MPRVSPYAMWEVSDALAAIVERARPLGVEHVQLTAARGRFLAEDVVADADLPGLPRSSVDGYAVLAGDQNERRKVLEEVTAGHLGKTQVTEGAAVHIMTGGSLPEGADAVVMVEDVEEADGHAQGYGPCARPGCAEQRRAPRPG